MAKRKIFMVEIAGSGGIAHYTYNLLLHYPEPSQIHLYTGSPYEFIESPPVSHLKLIFNRFKTKPSNILSFFYDVVKNTPSYVHFQVSQYPSFILFLVLILKVLGVKVILTVHNVTSHEQKKLSNYILRFLYKYSDKIIVHSFFSKSRLESKFHISKHMIIKINHGNYGFLLDQSTNMYRPPKKLFTILFFGYIRKYKGLRVLLEALSLPRINDLNFQLVIAGKPVEPFKPYDEMIEQLDIKCKIIKRLEYLPFENVKSLFYDASVVVLPYTDIDQSGVLHMAYAFSRPVIASSVGGFPEVVEDAYSGYLVPSGDAVSLAEAIKKLIDNRDLVEILGKNAFELSQNRFSWIQISKQTQDLYLTLMQ